MSATVAHHATAGSAPTAGALPARVAYAVACRDTLAALDALTTSPVRPIVVKGQS